MFIAPDPNAAGLHRNATGCRMVWNMVRDWLVDVWGCAYMVLLHDIVQVERSVWHEPA